MNQYPNIKINKESEIDKNDMQYVQAIIHINNRMINKHSIESIINKPEFSDIKKELIRYDISRIMNKLQNIFNKYTEMGAISSSYSIFISAFDDSNNYFKPKKTNKSLLDDIPFPDEDDDHYVDEEEEEEEDYYESNYNYEEKEEEDYPF